MTVSDPSASPTAAEPFEEGTGAGADGGEQDRRLRERIEHLDLDLDRLAAAVAADTVSRGVRFGAGEEEDAFRIDPVPRLIDAGEWHGLEDGVIQRVRALELFVKDVYGERRIVAAGVLPAEAIETANHFEPLLMGMGEQIRSWITVVGLDVVRDSDGSFKVLEDNLRTPSGIAYALATREILCAQLPPPSDLQVRSLDGVFEMLARGLRAAAPLAASEDPCMILLTDGEQNSAYYEHVVIAQRIGLPLVLPEQLSVRAGRLFAWVDGRECAVDVVYRRTDEDQLTDEQGDLTAVAELLLEPIRGGTLACVNSFGTGVADDKLVHAYVEEMVRFYLDEEPLLRSVPTYDPGESDTLEMILERIDELVIKPRSGHGGYGVVIGPHARADDIERAGAALRAAPHDFVAQEMVMLSTHPTVIDGALEPRHIDLRSFAVSSEEMVEVLPGGLTRVAFERGALVVNSSQNGGSKDTWVLT